MSLTIYSYPNSYRVNKALIAARYVGVSIATPAFELGKDNVTEAFKAKNPTGKVPVLETPQGALFESNAIARYVARLSPAAGLLGATPYEQAQVDQWIDFSTNELEPARNVWLYTIKGYLPPNPKALAEAKKDVESALAVLDQVFLRNTYIVGNAVTLADITLFSALVDGYATLFAPAYVTKYANVHRWFVTIGNQPNVKAVTGELVFAKAEAALPKAEKAPKADKAAEASGEKAEKAAAAPKAEKAAAAPKAAAEDDYDDEKPVPKPKNPLDDLPESPMVLDTIKKLAFSQRPFLPTFFEQLWPQFDNAGYSVFTCHYKYNDENKVFYMTGNAVGGFIQRSDACRKYAMGVMNIYGNPDEETPPFKVCGAWIFRGPGIIAEMVTENPDSEYYEWKKVDVTTPEGQAIVKEQFQAEQLYGENVLDRRYFK